jgi:hypothetical protein
MRKTAITVAKEWKKERKKYNLFLLSLGGEWFSKLVPCSEHQMTCLVVGFGAFAQTYKGLGVEATCTI